jgi:hypothetical protein
VSGTFLQRNSKAVERFTKTHSTPPGCNQCLVDRIIPLGKGGKDVPSDT